MSNKISLPEEDYLGIIDLQHRFVQCKSRDALYECIERHFLPRIDCQSAFFGWINPDFTTNTVAGSVGVSKECTDYFSKLDPYMKSMNEKLVTNARPVIACDIDVARKTIIKESSPFYRDHPEYKRPAAGIGYCIATGKVVTTYMLAIDRSENAIFLLGAHRWMPNDRHFTLRDVRVMELVRPILFQTIKAIVLSEELAQQKSLAESLADIPTGVALLRKDMRVIFLNKAFQYQIPLEPGHTLPAKLESIVKMEMKRISKPKELLETLPDQTFYKLPGGEFRLSIDLVNKDSEDQGYLLRLKPANDAFSQLNLTMQAGELSNREKEICCLAKDGFSNEQIANRLFLSPLTVKTHMKHIYKKMNLQKRAKLVALLNRTGQSA